MHVVRKRTELEIYFDVLMSVKECEDDAVDGVTGSKPTRIMRASNLSWHPCIQKLNSLMKLKLVEEIPCTVHKTTRVYRLTDEGEKMIPVIRGLGAFGKNSRSYDNEKYKNALKKLDLILGYSVEKIAE